MFALLVALMIPADTAAAPPVAGMEIESNLFFPRAGVGLDPTLIPAPATMSLGRLRFQAPGPVGAPPEIIEYSDAYLTRLKIHKYASYATLPLFAAAYLTGNELIKNGGNAASWARNTHGTIAGSLAVLFGVNTVTGLWNLYDSRKDPEGRTRRILHSALLLAADAGFLATAALAGESEGGGGEWRGTGGDNSAHRAMAITSMGLAFTGYMTMSWPFRRD
jgi:hypothetical protein